MTMGCVCKWTIGIGVTIITASHELKEVITFVAVAVGLDKSLCHNSMESSCTTGRVREEGKVCGDVLGLSFLHHWVREEGKVLCGDMLGLSLVSCLHTTCYNHIIKS